MNETTTPTAAPTADEWRDLGTLMLRRWGASVATSGASYQRGAFVARADVALLLADAPTPEEGLRRVYEELRLQAEGSAG